MVLFILVMYLKFLLTQIAKTFAGAGSFNTGESISLYNAYSQTNTNDADGIDQPITLTL